MNRLVYHPLPSGVHPLADVELGAHIHDSAKIWRWTHIRSGAVIGPDVTIGQCCFVDRGVHVPEGCKLQNSVQLPRGVVLGKYCFLGSHVTFTNDKEPHAQGHWEIVETIVGDRVSIGANAVILPGLKIGHDAMIGAGSVVTHNIPDGAVVAGNPVRILRYSNPSLAQMVYQGGEMNPEWGV